MQSPLDIAQINLQHREPSFLAHHQHFDSPRFQKRHVSPSKNIQQSMASPNKATVSKTILDVATKGKR